MELLLILIYVSLCYVVFKVFRIPVNQWSLATAALGGIIGIALLLLIMNYNHPFTTNARIYFAVTPVLPGVKGRVIDVPVQANAPLKEGDVLFRIDPKPYEYVVDQKEAMLAEAEQNVRQLKASLDQATAAAERTNSQFELAQQNYDRQAELFEKKVIAQATLDTFTRNLETARQSLAGARAEEERARLAYSSNIDGVNTTVARLQAELARCAMGPQSDRDPGACCWLRHPGRPAAGNVRRSRAVAAGHGVRQYGQAGPGVRGGLPAEFPAAGQGRRRGRGRFRCRARSRSRARCASYSMRLPPTR
jgi:multidrug efflux pump subunit AcrA (membrane-fusion protein)